MAVDSWSAHLGPGGAWDGGAGPTLPAIWVDRWSRAPRARILHFGGVGIGTMGRWCTAEELSTATAHAAEHLAGAGVSAGDRIVWAAEATLPSVVACLGALRLGAVVVPVSAAATERELAHVIADVRPVVAVSGNGVSTFSGAPGALVASDLAKGARTAMPLVLDAAEPDDPALIVYTSGTTGAPKGAVLTHANLVAGCRALEFAWRWVPDDLLVLSLPLFHVHGLCAGLFGTLSVGASAVVLGGFQVAEILDVVDLHHATLFFGVPTMYHRLVGAPGADLLGRLRLCVSGSAPLPPALWNQVRITCGATVLERYGMTETMLTVSNPYEGQRRPGTVGFPLPGVELRLPESDGPAPLLVSGPSVFSGYWERPAATAESFDGAWFATGDMAELDRDGYLAIRGRRSDTINSGGFNVYPAEVEDVLLGHPAVAEVAVAGSPSEEWGEVVTAWVVPADTVDEGELAAFAAGLLAPYKRPRRIHLIDALPRNAMGKVQRSELGR